jgi:hypothetical protein
VSIGRISIIFILIIMVFFPACDGVFENESPPYVITKPVFETTKYPDYFYYAGIVFKFLNTSMKDVDRITVSFMLFDAKTQANPFIGSNKFEITKLILVPVNENREIIISLDQYIYIAPTEPYIIDFFYISEIHYIDGSTWKDEKGIYRERLVK